MKEIAWKKLSSEGFAQYGSYANMINPSGPHLGVEPIEFYRDRVQSDFGTLAAVSFSVCRVMKRPFVIDVSEYHDTTCEIVLPLDGDVLMHLAPAVGEKEFPADLAEVFLVPKGTIVCFRPGVWHHAPFAFRSECVNCLVALPERTYMSDCKAFPLPTAHHLRIVGEGIR